MGDLPLLQTEHPERISSYFRKEKKLLSVMSLCAVIFDGGLSLVPILQGKMIDTIVQRGSLHTVLVSAGTFLLAVIILQTCRIGKRFCVRRFANKTGALMRMTVYHTILRRGAASLNDEKIGDMLTKAIGDVDISVEGMRKCTTEVFDTGLLMVSYLVALFMQSWRITLLSIPFVPLSMFLAHKLNHLVTEASGKARSALSRATGAAYGMISEAVLIRTDSLEKTVKESYRTILDGLQKTATKSTVLETSMEPLYKAVATLGVGVALYCGGKNVVAGSWTIGQYSAYMTLLLALAGKASKAAKLFNSFQKAKVSFARVKPFLSECPEEDMTIHNPLDIPANLVVRDLSYTYPGTERPIIRQISFTGKAGEIIGVTGGVASGKTSLGVALEGLTPYRGSIMLGGRELSSLTGFEKGSAISYQGHNSELLSDSIRENVTLGESGSIEEVLQDVCFGEDLRTMKQGINTIVGPGGVRLSGGQAARISLARALWRHTPLVILDDPFASVDHATEERIIHNLRLHHRSSLIILISHRLAIFPTADQVLFVHKDGTLEASTHDRLIISNQTYRKMFSLQRGGGQ